VYLNCGYSSTAINLIVSFYNPVATAKTALQLPKGIRHCSTGPSLFFTSILQRPHPIDMLPLGGIAVVTGAGKSVPLHLLDQL
jgi:hypothetical protein